MNSSNRLVIRKSAIWANMGSIPAKLAAQFHRAIIRRVHRASNCLLETVGAHRRERPLGRAALGGHALAKNRRRVGRTGRKLGSAAERSDGEPARRPVVKPESARGSLKCFYEEENVSRPAA